MEKPDIRNYGKIRLTESGENHRMNKGDWMRYANDLSEYTDNLVKNHSVSHHVSGSYLPKCTRVEVIDNSGRAYTNYDCESVETQMQDGERTLKVFIS